MWKGLETRTRARRECLSKKQLPHGRLRSEPNSPFPQKVAKECDCWLEIALGGLGQRLVEELTSASIPAQRLYFTL